MCGSRPDADGKRSLSSHAIGVNVAQVVDDEDGRDQAAHRDGREQSQSGDVMRHNKGRTYHGYRSEEKEDEELAQSQVTKWLGACGISDGSGDRQQTEHRQNRPTSPDEIETGSRRRYQYRRGRHDHLPGWDEAALRHTQRA